MPVQTVPMNFLEM